MILTHSSTVANPLTNNFQLAASKSQQYKKSFLVLETGLIHVMYSYIFSYLTRNLVLWNNSGIIVGKHQPLLAQLSLCEQFFCDLFTVHFIEFKMKLLTGVTSCAERNPDATSFLFISKEVKNPNVGFLKRSQRKPLMRI